MGRRRADGAGGQGAAANAPSAVNGRTVSGAPREAAGSRAARRVPRRGNAGILVLAALLAAFGVLMVYSASSYTALQQTGDAFFYMKKQLLGFVLGGAAMAGAAFFPYERLRKLKWAALGLSLALLALVLVPGLGVENYGATRWLGLGPVTVQPSEIAKYGFVLFAAAWAAEDPPRMRTFRGILPVLGAGAGICALILAEPNLSVTLCVGILLLVMLFLGGAKAGHFLVILLPLAAAVPVLVIAEPYRLQRLYAFLDPWSAPQGEGYQLIQSLYALGNGGWLGTGLFGSVQKYRYLPFAESDFILAVIGEEFGFLGIVLFFCASGLLIAFGIRAAARSRDRFGFLLAAGITAVYAVQTVLNALVVGGAVPPTGLPLPLISAGNTSLIVTMASMGVLYSVSRGGRPRALRGKDLS